MTLSFDCPDAAIAFLARATPPKLVDDSTVTSDIFLEDVIVDSKRLKRGEASGRDKNNQHVSQNFGGRARYCSRCFIYTGWLRVDCSRRR